MATVRKFVCSKCDPVHAGNLFKALYALATTGTPVCPNCGRRRRLTLTFDFGLNASHSKCTVLAAVLPETIRSWKLKNGARVRFYPFLVVLKRHGRGRAVWMPYWHLVGKGRTPIMKYGQWAPFMDLELFQSLLARARSILSK